MAGHPGRVQGRGQSRSRGQAGVGASGSTALLAAVDVPTIEDSALRAAVSERLGASRFDLWFGDGIELGLSGDGEALEVRVPDEFFRDWIRRHYTSSLLEAAEAVAGRPLRLSIEVNARGAALRSAAGIEARAPSARRVDQEEDRLDLPAPRNEAVVEPSPKPSERSAVSAPRSAAERSAPRDAPRRPLRRLEEFIAGAGSRLALAAAREMAQTAGVAFNPLVVHGGVGLGKTHLLEGIGHALRQAHPSLIVMQLTAEAFTNQFLEAMRCGSLSSFRNRFRGAGALLVDDVHFLAAKRATQDEFLHTFNALFDKGAPIVLSADQHPRLMTRLTDELVTRFLGGMVVKLEAPDQATRRTILQSRAATRGVDIPEAVVAYIAEHLRASVRELEGALHTVVAQALLTGKRLDLNLARTALRDTIRHTAQAVALRDVERAVCALFQITADALKSDSRARALAYPRMMAMYLARKHTGAAYSEIGRYFGGRNHSTVISAEKKVHGWLCDEERSSLLPGFETVGDLLADLERSLGT
jgi:chromosomal replication initiator protein